MTDVRLRLHSAPKRQVWAAEGTDQMVRRKAKTAAKPVEAVPPPANDEGELALVDLARGIVAREIRPRVADVRRLAEAVLAVQEKRARTKAGGKKKDGKKHKLAKIPGQKAKT